VRTRTAPRAFQRLNTEIVRSAKRCRARQIACAVPEHPHRGRIVMACRDDASKAKLQWSERPLHRRRYAVAPRKGVHRFSG